MPVRSLDRPGGQFAGPRGPRLLLLLLLAACGLRPALGQTPGPVPAPALEAGPLDSVLRLDGVLDDVVWTAAPAIECLTVTEPDEGGRPAGCTVVRVLASPEALVVGFEALDPNPEGIVSTSKARDPHLRGEDYVKLVFDPFLDGRSGFVFAVNPGGARYDALVAPGSMWGEDASWDAIWEARTSRGPNGWSAEIRIPVQSLTFDASLDAWGFNVERRVERLQEVSRWASPFRDAEVYQTSRAGRIVNLPRFDTGMGLTARVSVVPSVDKASGDAWTGDVEPSVDVFQRIGTSLTVVGTVNTDFAETEVDTRRTNLTRFPLFFPEKRAFFLEGSDLFAFGLGLSQFRGSDLVPFFSRRIGLLEEEEVAVPVLAGGKVTGKIGRTSLAGLTIRTREVEGIVDPTTMGAFRVRQDLFEESTAGLIATFGDPTGAPGAYLVGGDLTYRTTRFRGSKSFEAGVWGLFADREGLGGDRAAAGVSVAYPNDVWDARLTYIRIGSAFDPALGFVPRAGIQKASANIEYRIYPERLPWLRSAVHEFRPQVYWTMDGAWESYRIFMAPVNWQLESGDRFELNANPEGERLVEPFEIEDGVVIPPGTYHFIRYRVEAELASKRPVSGQIRWWLGSFYDGSLNQYEGRLRLKPSELVFFDIDGTRNVGDLPAGRFVQNVVGVRVALNVSSDLQLTSLVQYDDESRSIGTNTRLRWTFNPFGDLFLVHNHNVYDRLDRWAFESARIVLKLQYAFRW